MANVTAIEKQTPQVTLSTFEELRSIDVKDHIEKKNNFSYLSWAWALDVLYSYDSEAKFEFPEREIFPDGSVMIYCDVTVKGITKRGFLPVMDFKNNSVKNPDARKISDSMQRCLVKTIALHGLGLYIYAGEDIPPENQENEPKEDPKAREAQFDYINEINGITNLEELMAYEADNGEFWRGLPEMYSSTIQQQYESRAEQLKRGETAQGLYKFASVAKQDIWLDLANKELSALETKAEIDTWRNENRRIVNALEPKRKAGFVAKFEEHTKRVGE